MDISEFKVDKSKGEITWRCDGKLISVCYKDLDCAIQDSKVNLVLIIQKTRNNRGKLIGYNADGRKKFEVNPPNGFGFDFFERFRLYENEVQVVCGRTEIEKDDPWGSWHFIINPETGALTKGSPSK